MSAPLIDRARQISNIVITMDALQAELDLLLNEKSTPTKKKKDAARKTHRAPLAKKNTKVARKLKAWRKSNGYSLKQAASVFGVSDATFSHWEHGKNEPKGENAEKVKNVFSKAGSSI